MPKGERIATPMTFETAGMVRAVNFSGMPLLGWVYVDHSAMTDEFGVAEMEIEDCHDVQKAFCGLDIKGYIIDDSDDSKFSPATGSPSGSFPANKDGEPPLENDAVCIFGQGDYQTEYTPTIRKRKPVTWWQWIVAAWRVIVGK